MTENSRKSKVGPKVGLRYYLERVLRDMGGYPVLGCLGCMSLVAPYRAMLRYYRCGAPYRAILLKGGSRSPKMARCPPPC